MIHSDWRDRERREEGDSKRERVRHGFIVKIHSDFRERDSKRERRWGMDSL